eukprot:m.185664 g.185664  ORF g.185664 m.185664 type:complete len:261 (+) comp16916_c0_seq8:127-909(+)
MDNLLAGLPLESTPRTAPHPGSHTKEDVPFELPEDQVLELRLQLLERARLYGNARYHQEAAAKQRTEAQPKAASALPKPKRLDLNPRQGLKRSTTHPAQPSSQTSRPRDVIIGDALVPAAALKTNATFMSHLQGSPALQSIALTLLAYPLPTPDKPTVSSSEVDSAPNTYPVAVPLQDAPPAVNIFASTPKALSKPQESSSLQAQEQLSEAKMLVNEGVNLALAVQGNTTLKDGFRTGYRLMIVLSKLELWLLRMQRCLN